MRSKPALALISIAAVAFGACTSSAGGPSAPPATQVAIATLTASAVPEATPAASPSTEPSASTGGVPATPTSIDPCSLITADEASTAIGKKLGAGVSAKVDQLRVCTFKSGLTEVKLFLAPPAPDAATAQAYWDAERAQVPADIPIKDLSDFDREAYGGGSAGGVSLSALFVIKGTQFFDFFCGFPMCSETASAAEAKLIGGRLP